jgi:hypothetical protein
MKSLEHLIRDIREGKAEKGKKDSLEHAIRKVHEGKRDDIDASAGKYGGFDKMNTESDLNYMGSGTGGEPKMHAEDGKKKKTDEAVGTIGTDDFQGNQFKSVRTQTPHIKPPAGPGSHSQAPENVSRQRTLAKEKGSMTMHGKVSEGQLDEFLKQKDLEKFDQSGVAPTEYLSTPLFTTGAGAEVGGVGKGKTQTRTQTQTKSGQKTQTRTQTQTNLGQPARKAPEPKIPAGPPIQIPGGKPSPVQPDRPEQKPANDPGRETPVVPKPTIPDSRPPTRVPAREVPTPANTPVAPTTPKPTEPAPTVPVPRTPPAPAAPAPAETPKRWKEVGPPMPAETRPKQEPSRAPVQLPDINIPGTKVKPGKAPDTKVQPDTKEQPATKPAAEPDTKVQPDTKVAPATKPAAEPRVVQLPAIDVGARTKTATDTKVAPATVTAPAAVETPAATTPKSAETTTTPKDKDFRFPGISFPIATGYGYDVSHRLGVKKSRGIAKAHRMHEESERKQIENVPRKGDRKSIAYVGRSEDEPKTAKEKTSRQAAYKINVIDENKKLAGIVLSTVKDKKQQMKARTEDGLGQSSKNIQYPNGTVVSINPELSRTTMDIDGKLPNDYK